MNLSELFIIGASGHASVIADAAKRCGQKVKFVVLDDEALSSNEFVSERKLEEHLLPESGLILGMGSIGRMQARQKIIGKFEDISHKFSTVIHPAAHIGADVKMGKGVFVSCMATISPNATIGDHSIINTGAIVEHDAVIGSNCHIAPGAIIGGSVIVGDNSFVGTGATIIQQVRIAGSVVIGAGSVCLKDIIENDVLYAGTPARCMAKY